MTRPRRPFATIELGQSGEGAPGNAAMFHININRAHNLTAEQAREVVAALVNQLTARYEGHAHWQEGSLHLDRPGNRDYSPIIPY